MATNQTHPESIPSTGGIDRDVLVLRVVEGLAGESDWAALQNLAERDSGIWTEITQARRCRDQLHAAVCGIVGRADRVDAPVELAETADVVGTINPVTASEAVNAWRAKRVGVLGWGVAACLALALAVQMNGGRERGNGNTAGIQVPATYSSPEAAMEAYLQLGKQSGQVMGEMPQSYVIKKTPTVGQNGEAGYEVLYLRQFIERAVVSEKDVYRLGTDELGRTVLVPTRPPAPTGGSSPSPY